MVHGKNGIVGFQFLHLATLHLIIFKNVFFHYHCLKKTQQTLLCMISAIFV